MRPTTFYFRGLDIFEICDMSDRQNLIKSRFNILRHTQFWYCTFFTSSAFKICEMWEVNHLKIVLIPCYNRSFVGLDTLWILLNLAFWPIPLWHSLIVILLKLCQLLWQTVAVIAVSVGRVAYIECSRPIVLLYLQQNGVFNVRILRIKNYRDWFLGSLC